MLVIAIPVVRTVFNPETGETLDIPTQNQIEVKVYDGVLHFVRGGNKGSRIEELNKDQVETLDNISKATA